MLLALNTYPQASNPAPWRSALDRAAAWGIDAVILADPGLMRYATDRHPQLRLHLSVQGSATNHDAINLYQQQFNIQRAVLPRVLSLEQVKQVTQRTNVEIEVFGFGSLCVMVEGRCALSSYVTGESPNTHGVCSPPKSVRWQETPKGLESRLNGVLIDRYGNGENAGYPTLCKGRFDVGAESNYYALEEPTSLNTLELLPQLVKMGVRAFKIEGRQRSPAYVAQVTKVWREAIDHCMAQGHLYAPKTAWMASLVTNWMGDAGFLKRIRTRMSRFNTMGDCTWARGTVTKKYVKDGHALVDIEIMGENQRGELTTPGLATVGLPSLDPNIKGFVDGSNLDLDLPVVR